MIGATVPRMEPLDLRRVRYFVAVAEEQHFGRAADRLNMSAPPLSQRIQELERDLGLKLFERTSRKVALTSAGERLLVEARLVLAAAQQFEATAALLARPVARTLRFGCCHGSEAGATRSARAFRVRHPDTTVRLDALTSRQMLDQLTKSRLDVGIVREPIPPTVTSRHLAHVPVDHIVLSPDHRLAALATVHVTDLAGETLFLVDRAEAPAYHDDAVGYLTSNNVKANWVLHSATQVERVFDMVAVGSGIGWLNAWQAERGTGRDDVAIRPLSPVARADDFFVIWRPDDSLIQELVDCIVAECGS
jgi:DNA-binding transcriptional LysR family regulator